MSGTEAIRKIHQPMPRENMGTKITAGVIGSVIVLCFGAYLTFAGAERKEAVARLTALERITSERATQYGKIATLEGNMQGIKDSIATLSSDFRAFSAQGERYSRKDGDLATERFDNKLKDQEIRFNDKLSELLKVVSTQLTTMDGRMRDQNEREKIKEAQDQFKKETLSSIVRQLEVNSSAIEHLRIYVEQNIQPKGLRPDQINQ
jgi:hypothetical protein